jgi:hypothetical protein
VSRALRLLSHACAWCRMAGQFCRCHDAFDQSRRWQGASYHAVLEMP